jgi:hypothetical protein
MMTGPVGVRAAERFRQFRYQMRVRANEPLPDEAYVAGAPVRLAEDCALARRILELTASVPPFTWGRRAPDTSEMWTSDSAISWLLLKAGVDVAEIRPPPGARAPGWIAGIEVAGRTPR